MYLHHHSQFLSMAKLREILSQQGVCGKEIPFHLICSFYVLRDLEHYWIKLKKRVGFMGFLFFREL